MAGMDKHGRRILWLVEKTPGWTFLRRVGSHLILRSPANRNVLVPVNLDGREPRAVKNYLAKLRREGLPI